MQLCLDGKDPLYHEDSINEESNHESSNSSSTIIGRKGMIGIQNYLKLDDSLPESRVRNLSAQKIYSENIQKSSDQKEELYMSPSYAERVSTLLKTPTLLPLTGNKENKSICNEIKSCDTGSGQKLARKRSLTEMIGHNPLSKERKPLGQKRCFETDL